MSIKKLQRYYLDPDFDEVPHEDGDYCLTEDVTELEATNAELVKALEYIKRGLTEANPNCGKLYLFQRMSNAFEIAEKALASAKG